MMGESSPSVLVGEANGEPSGEVAGVSGSALERDWRRCATTFKAIEAQAMHAPSPAIADSTCPIVSAIGVGSADGCDACGSSLTAAPAAARATGAEAGMAEAAPRFEPLSSPG